MYLLLDGRLITTLFYIIAQIVIYVYTCVGLKRRTTQKLVENEQYNK